MTLCVFKQVSPWVEREMHITAGMQMNHSCSSGDPWQCMPVHTCTVQKLKNVTCSRLHRHEAPSSQQTHCAFVIKTAGLMSRSSVRGSYQTREYTAGLKGGEAGGTYCKHCELEGARVSCVMRNSQI
jgi:hypothetical protein